MGILFLNYRILLNIVINLLLTTKQDIALASEDPEDFVCSEHDFVQGRVKSQENRIKL